MMLRKKRKNKPLNTFTTNHKLLHSINRKSTYFYKHKWFSYLIPSITTLALFAVFSITINPIVNKYKASAAPDPSEATNPPGTTVSTIKPTDYASLAFAIIHDNEALADEATVSTEAKYGEVAYITNTISVYAINISKFYVGIQATSNASSELTGATYGAKINGVGTNVTPSKFADNTWGYSLVSRNNAPNNNELTYSTLPKYDAGATPQYQSTSNPTDGEYGLKLVFAAKINADKPADHYQTSALVSVVAEAKYLTLSNLTYMQDMTPNICANSSTNETKRLVDRRDSKSYWVAKLADNHCWMTQNLDLDLSTNWPNADLSDYTSATGNYMPTTTATTATASTISSSTTGTLSWSLGDYVITNPIAFSECGSGKNSFANCTSYFTSTSGKTASTDANFYTNNSNRTVVGNTYDAHYTVGNHYQWNTATAGFGGITTSGQASGSICPKNWRLPASTDTTIGSYKGILDAGGIASNAPSKFFSPPFYFVAAGTVWNDSTSLLTRAGSRGIYWSSTVYDTAMSWDLYSDSTQIFATNHWNKSIGQSIRCVAR